MPRKRLPIFLRASKMLKVSIFLTKLRKPIIPNLVLFRKSQRSRKFKLIDTKRYGYGFVRDYEFSPSKSPLIGFQRKEFGQKVCSMLFLCRCLGFERGDFGDLPLQIEALPAVDEDLKAGVVLQPLDWIDDEDDHHDHGEGGDEDDHDSIDLRAEEFIERFYEEMRMQRQKSKSNLDLE